MRMGQGVRTGLGHGGITCVLQTHFSSCHFDPTFGLVSAIGLKIIVMPPCIRRIAEGH